MTSFQETSFLSEIAQGQPIPPGKLAYFQERQRNRIYDFVLTKFLEKESGGALTKAQLARRIHRGADQVNRWLAAPGNWTLDTISDLLLGIAAEELQPVSVSLLNRSVRNYACPDWVQVGGTSLSTLSLPPTPTTVSTVKFDHHTAVKISATG